MAKVTLEVGKTYKRFCDGKLFTVISIQDGCDADDSDAVFVKDSEGFSTTYTIHGEYVHHGEYEPSGNDLIALSDDCDNMASSILQAADETLEDLTPELEEQVHLVQEDTPEVERQKGPIMKVEHLPWNEPSPPVTIDKTVTNEELDFLVLSSQARDFMSDLLSFKEEERLTLLSIINKRFS